MDNYAFKPIREDLLAEMRAQNINIFPLQPRSKIPMAAWKQYQTENFEGVIPPENNYAIVCGKISENLAVFDFDNCDSTEILNNVLDNALNSTLIVKTSRGFHVYLKLDKEIKNMKLTKGEVIIDVQSTGKYVVGGTSIHPSGMEYEIVSKTLTIKRLFGTEVLQHLFDAGFTGMVDEAGTPTTGADIAKGGVKYGSLHNSFLKFCNYTIMVMEITDYHSYKQACENWNRKGNNEFQINEHDYNQVMEDSWKHCMEKKERQEQGEDVEKTKKEKPHYYALKVAEELPFKTMADTDEILYYEDGVYLLGGERQIAEICQRIIPECAINDIREVTAEIRRCTYVDREAFDRDPYKICMKNVVIDVLSGDLLEHSPDLLYRNKIPVTYDPIILPIEVPKFLRECHLEPKTIYKLIEEAAYVLLREPLFQVAFMYTGVGSNGKSVWLDWLRDFFGKENASEVSLHDLASNRFRVAELDGKLINIYADLKSTALKENEIIKPLIGGDAITVEKKMQHPFSMKPYTKLFFSANRIPEISDESIGMYRRLSLTRWDIVFTEIDRDVNKLKTMNTDYERSGMFNIFLRTLKKLLKRGRFLNENSIEDRRNTWKVTADPIIEYVEQYIAKISEGGISYDELYNHFTSVVEQHSGEKVILKPTFNRKILALTGATRGSVREHGLQKSIFKGITLRDKLKDDAQASLDGTPPKPDSAFVNLN